MPSLICKHIQMRRYFQDAFDRKKMCFEFLSCNFFDQKDFETLEGKAKTRNIKILTMISHAGKEKNFQQTLCVYRMSVDGSDE